MIESAWNSIETYFSKTGKHLNLKTLFNDSNRFKDFSLTFESETTRLLFDFSKNLITKETLSLLEKLLVDSDFYKIRQAMFNGDLINYTENRPVLHVALVYLL